MVKENGKFISDSKLAAKLGWGVRRLRTVYRSKSFGSVRVADVDAFLNACGLTWSSQRRVRSQLRDIGANFYQMRHMRTTVYNQASMIRRHQKQLEKVLANL